MKLAPLLLSLLIAISIFSGYPFMEAKEKVSCVLVYYNQKTIPPEILRTHDWIIVDPDNPYLKPGSGRAKLIAYISVGGIGKYRSYF
jgi:hypothetical protein